MTPRALVALAVAVGTAAALIVTGGSDAAISALPAAAGTTAAIAGAADEGKAPLLPANEVAVELTAAPRSTVAPAADATRRLPVTGSSAAPRRWHFGCPENAPPVTPPLATPGRGPAGSVQTTGTSGVALTFDDGPDPVNTPKLLDLLKKCNVKATFCVVGHRARDNPDLIRRIFNEGHTLCNHTWQHLIDLGAPSRTDDYIRGDLGKTNKYIHIAVPGAPIKYFRAPGGNFTPRLVAIAAELGMTSIDWSVDPKDWDRVHYGSGQAMVDHIIKVVLAETKPGGIVLSHDNLKPDTISAYALLLPLLAHFYTLIPLPT